MSQLHRFLRASGWTLLSGIIAAILLQGCAGHPDRLEAVCFAPDDPKEGNAPFMHYFTTKELRSFDVIGFLESGRVPKGQTGCSPTPASPNPPGGPLESASTFLLLEGAPPNYTVSATQPAGSEYFCAQNSWKCMAPGSICSRVNGNKFCKHAVLKTTDPGHATCMCACKP